MNGIERRLAALESRAEGFESNSMRLVWEVAPGETPMVLYELDGSCRLLGEAESTGPTPEEQQHEPH